MKEGVLYIAFGKNFLEEAIISAKSFKSHHKNISTAIITSEIVDSPYFDIIVNEKAGENNIREKVKWINHSPFERTLYIDTDTYFNDNISELFGLLDKFDFLLTHAPMRQRFNIGIPDAFPDFNGGLIGFNNTNKNKEILNNWLVNFDDFQFLSDQPSLRKSLYNSTVRYHVLPPEYNYRTWQPGFIGGNSTVKILHGRPKDFKKIADELNRVSTKTRVFIPNVINNKVWYVGSTSPFGKIVLSVFRFKMRLFYFLKNPSSIFKAQKSK